MTQSKTNREIRVFLSSTFRDMQFERDYLIKTIFPEVRKACRERLVEFTEIDLRWGVTEQEATQGKVVRICLEEIDRCRPYFLGFMGERYGWEPAESDLFHMDELVQLFPLVAPSLKSRKSVTEMEILHGVLESPKMVGHAFFYLRDKALTDELATKSGNPPDYFDAEATSNAKLLELKARVKGSGFPYHENYSDLEVMGKQVKADLLAVLDQLYPQDKTPTPLEAERITHEAYAADRCQAYLPSEQETGALDAYIQSRNQSGEALPLIIGGESGLGKSALLAYWLSTYQQTNPKSFVIQHYSGVSGDATPMAVLRRIMLEIKVRNSESDEVPTKPDDIVKDFPLWLAKVREGDPLLLVIDAINQIEGDNLNWLPSFIPHNVTLIVSALPGTHFDQLQQRSWLTHQVQPLNVERRHQLIQNYLHKTYSKKLSNEQIITIASAPQSSNPLFLITLLEELRVFGVFEKLNERIADYLQAPTPAELFAKVLQRMEADYRDKNDASTIVPVVKAIWASRKGLNETELLGITGLNRQDLSVVLLAMDYHLSNKSGLRNFFHDYLRQAVGVRYLNSDQEKQAQHRQLAEYFDKQTLDARKADELPWQWQQAHEYEKLKDCLVGIPMFGVLFEKDPYELLGYWLLLMQQYDVGQSYAKSFEEWSASINEELEIASTANQLAMFLSDICAQYAHARPLYERALTISKKTFGAEHPTTAEYLNNLAGLLQAQGDYAAAHTLFEGVLAFREKTLGAEHHDTANSLNNLASLLQAQGDYAAARPLFERALAIREKALGKEHRDTATSLNNLAGLLNAQGDYATARPLYERALAIVENTLGVEHPSTAKCLGNLALLLQAQGDYEAARPLFERALAIDEMTLGADNPSTATTLNNLAGLLQAQCDYAAARPLFERALAIDEKTLGAEHPSTAKCLGNLAGLLQAQGDYAAARPLYERELAIFEKAIGAEHPDTATSLNNLAYLLQSQGDYAAARPLYERSLAIFEKALGAEHPDTVTSLNNLAYLLVVQGDYAATRPLYERALAIREKSLGAEHPNTVTSLNNLAVLLKAQGDYAAACPLFERSLAIREKILGAEHPDTANSLNELASLLNDQGDYAAARPLYERLLEINEKTLGDEHPDTFEAERMIARCLRESGSLNEAILRFEVVIEKLKRVAGESDSATLWAQSGLASTFEKAGKLTQAKALLTEALGKAVESLGEDDSVTQDLREQLKNLE